MLLVLQMVSLVQFHHAGFLYNNRTGQDAHRHGLTADVVRILDVLHVESERASPEIEVHIKS